MKEEIIFGNGTTNTITVSNNYERLLSNDIYTGFRILEFICVICIIFLIIYFLVRKFTENEEIKNKLEKIKSVLDYISIITLNILTFVCCLNYPYYSTKHLVYTDEISYSTNPNYLLSFIVVAMLLIFNIFLRTREDKTNGKVFNIILFLELLAVQIVFTRVNCF